jgi:PHS family inorganic phosphate transporter-like MFS transporter
MAKSNDDGDLLRALDQAKTGKFHVKAIFTAGMGFFSDAYDLFVTSTAIPIIVAVFGITNSNNIFGTSYIGPLGAASVETGMIGAMALFGAFVGAIVFGRIADLKGRRYIYGLEMTILLVFAIVSAFSINIPMLMISRFILGIGVGGGLSCELHHYERIFQCQEQGKDGVIRIFHAGIWPAFWKPHRACFHTFPAP